MRITTLYVYPIKALRGISLRQAHVGPRGVQYDRHFILYEVRSDPESPSSNTTPVLKKVQLDSHPKCALFEQQIDHATKSVNVHFRGTSPDGSSDAQDAADLTVPLEPDVSSLTKTAADLHGSVAQAYAMGETYDSWFSARFGVQIKLVYIGDGGRAVLGKTLPPSTSITQQQQQQAQSNGGGWLSSITSYVTGTTTQTEKKPAAAGPWLTFTDVAPLLVASESSLEDVSKRLPEENRPMPMYKFRPNVVVDGEGEQAWAEDYWAELTVGEEKHKLAMTGNCVRCISLNVDYETGKPAEGEMGNVLKKLMKDRRVDTGSKWSPVFGRYGFPQDEEGFVVSVGDEVEVTKRNSNRTVWDWPGL
ncbi:MOSC domain-containing protein [Cladorrhinum sp. PSN332]|nr:MOSC domain-containing protein [Cladorrhinum sp. PSN332]